MTPIRKACCWVSDSHMDYLCVRWASTVAQINTILGVQSTWESTAPPVDFRVLQSFGNNAFSRTMHRADETYWNVLLISPKVILSTIDLLMEVY